jgi:hypothetical protein
MWTNPSQTPASGLGTQTSLWTTWTPMRQTRCETAARRSRATLPTKMRRPRARRGQMTSPKASWTCSATTNRWTLTHFHQTPRRHLLRAHDVRRTATRYLPTRLRRPRPVPALWRPGGLHSLPRAPPFLVAFLRPTSSPAARTWALPRSDTTAKTTMRGRWGWACGGAVHPHRAQDPTRDTVRPRPARRPLVARTTRASRLPSMSRALSASRSAPPTLPSRRQRGARPTGVPQRRG